MRKLLINPQQVAKLYPMRKLLINPQQVAKLYNKIKNDKTALYIDALSKIHKLSTEKITEKHVGRNIICINADNICLTPGAIYTIERVRTVNSVNYPNDYCNVMVVLKEKSSESCYNIDRFKLIEQD